MVTTGSTPVVNVFVTNTTGKPAMLSGWIDVNGDGVFDDTTERAEASVGLAQAESIPLEFPEILPGFQGETYARFRLGLKDDPTSQLSTGAAGIGEVEDYRAQVTIPARTDLPSQSRDTDINAWTRPDNAFGSSMAAVGDLDVNGLVDIAVGAPGDDTGGRERGTVHILFRDDLGAFNRVKRRQRIASQLTVHE